MEKDKTTSIQKDKTTSVQKDKTTSIGRSSLIIHCWLMAVLATLSFSSCGNSSSRRAERLRLERACTIDTTLSTARDLLVLTRYCMADSLFAEIVGTPYADLPLTDGRHMPCWNTNQLLNQYEGCIGVKTGFTRKAGACLAASVSRPGGSTLTLVLLKSKTHASRFTEAQTLFDFGFNVVDAI